MANTEQVQVAAAPVKVKAPKARKPAAKPTHPPTEQLVNAAIVALKERTGSSLQAIKKYIGTNNNVDADKLSPFIKKYLKKATANGRLIQTKGHGASGSFKLSAAAQKPKTEKKKKPVAKKAVKPKASKPKAVKSKPTKAKKPKSKVASKQKSLKPSAGKPRAPKPKKAQAKKPVTAAKKAPKAK